MEDCQTQNLYSGFHEIQNTIDNGLCMAEGPHHLAFLYVKDRFKPEIYFLLVKTNKRRNELWLVTFHRLQLEQYTKRLKPTRIVRRHAPYPPCIEDAIIADE